MPPPLAYFLTWSVHGTWLHGDERGSVDRDNNARHMPPLPPDPARYDAMRARLKSPPRLLDEDARRIVDQTIRDHCRHRSWVLLALNVRSNHVHVVVRCPPDTTPEDAMSQLKAWCTRRLRAAGLAAAKPWTEHGSTRWINTDTSLNSAIDYVIRLQD